MLVDVSATAASLDRLGAAAPDGAGMLLGAGPVPGLSTILVAALDAEPGDDLDLAIVLGGGEAHGPAAVDWTAGLAGRALHDPPEGGRVRNLVGARRLPGAFGARRHLRADFPDHLLIGAPRGARVRGWLAIDSRIATAALGVVGIVPVLRGVVSRAPHLGGDGWSLTAINRRTGETIAARGRGQSRTTGVLTARMALAAARARPTSAVTAADLLILGHVRGVAGIEVRP